MKTAYACLGSFALLGLMVLAARAQDAVKPSSQPVNLLPRTRTSGPTSKPTSRPDTRPVIEVLTADDLLNAIGPDRIIQLAARDYNLGEARQKRLKHVLWVRAYPGFQVTIRDVHNLRIETKGEQAARIVAKSSGAVLRIENSEGLELRNVTLGHADIVGPEGAGESSSGILSLYKTKDLRLARCTLTGGGMEGFTMDEVEDVVATDCVVRDCTSSIMTLTACANIAFNKCQFMNNAGCSGLLFNDSEKIKFDGCLLQGNTITEDEEGGFISAVSCSDIIFRKCEIVSNRFKQLMWPAECVKLDDVKTTDNTAPVDSDGDGLVPVPEPRAPAGGF